ncbi:MAG: quinol:electron acceptor oxidoreductase subunit ActD [Pirellulales bacterium]|jgi:hypothetical protein
MNSLPSDVPVAFEAAILLAGFGSVFALFAVCKLYPGKQVRMISPRVTDDQFVLVINEANASFDLLAGKCLLQKYDVIAVEEKLLCLRGGLL